MTKEMELPVPRIALEAGDILRKVYGVLFGHPMNVSFIDEYVCGTARPMSKKELEWLVREEGVKAVLSVMEKPLPSDWLGDLAGLQACPC